MTRQSPARRIAVWLCIIGVPLGSAWCRTDADLSSSNVDAEHIVQVRIGMTVPEVIDVLGRPFTIEPKPPDIYGENASLMTYTRPVETAWAYPMLWVHLKDGRVVEVYAKRYQGFEDHAVYALNHERQWQSDDFEATFTIHNDWSR